MENVKCDEKKKYRIVASAEGESFVNMELTEEQYKFLDNLFDLLNDNSEPYAPHLYIDPIL